MTGYWLVCIGYGGSFLAFIYIEKLLAVSFILIIINNLCLAKSLKFVIYILFLSHSQPNYFFHAC